MDKTTSFGLPFFYRVLVPGSVCAVLTLPLLIRGLTTIGVAPQDQAFALLALLLGYGILLAALDDPIYEILEGRLLWPTWFCELRKSRWNKHVRNLARQLETLQSKDPRSLEIWDDLRRFPLDESGKFRATRPTRLGNLLASYEDYSDRVYGLHATAFWPRIWLKLDKDVREDIDRAWAVADSFTYIAFAMLMIGALYVVLALASVFLAQQGMLVFFYSADERAVAIYSGFVVSILALIPYQISLSGHMRNGDLMKGMFDTFRDKLGGIELPLSEDQISKNRKLGGWLTYGGEVTEKLRDSAQGITHERN